MSTIKERVHKVVRDQLGVNAEDILEDSTTDSLGADSLDEVELIMALEDEFEFEIRDEDAVNLLKISAIVEHITETVEG